MEAANASLKAITSHYYALVTEFAKELLVAKDYYALNPTFWVDSGLVCDLETQQEVFDTACAACSDFNSLFPQDTVQVLFQSHVCLVSALDASLSTTNLDGSFYEALD